CLHHALSRRLASVTTTGPAAEGWPNSRDFGATRALSRSDDIDYAVRLIMRKDVRNKNILQRGLGALVTLGVAFSCLSCSADKGQPVFPVRGKVYFEGEPARGALVVFHPMNQSDLKTAKPRAVVEDDGSFALTTFVAKDGAPPGDYAVSIAWKKKT